MAIDVSALNNFVNETAGQIVMDSVFVGTTAEYATIQEGVKYSTPINLASVDPYFQGGDAVTTLSGSADFSQRNLTTTKQTALDGWNLQTLTEKYLGISALPEGSYEETFNLVDGLSSDLVKKAQKKSDEFIWGAVNGQVFAGSSVTAAADGLKAVISGSTAGVANPTGAGTGSIAADTAYDQLVDFIDNLNEDVLDREDVTFFCGSNVFTKIVSGLTKQNLFHFDPTSVESRNGMFEVPMPGFPNIKIVATAGLRGSERVVLGPSQDIFIGTDLVSDIENFKMWYSIDDDLLKYRLRHKIAANVAHPEYWVSNDLA